jgi:CheY-like chemotaxis protein
MEKLKSNPNTRHIPVHFISGTDQHQEAHRMGAIGYTLKPVGMGELGETFKRIEEVIAQTFKKVLIVVDHPQRQAKITEMVGGENVETVLVSTKSEVYQKLHTISFDCMVVDVDTEHHTGIQLLDEMQRDETLSQLPVIVYAERELTPEENQTLQRYAQLLTVKSVKSPERLLEEVTLFLHQIESNLPADQQQMLRTVYDKEAIFAHKKVLLVDDDSRNVFALTVTLDDKGMEVLTAENGIEALEILKQHQDLDLVLMDIMMPEMDGYETMRRIRAQPRFRKLPIIALTAKAMKEDKAKCIEAGANDYLAKPVDTNKLLSLMRVWLYQ